MPISVAVGAPLSTWILGFDGFGGLRGWQWLFIVEGLPAVLSTYLVLRFLTDRPASASWLTTNEKAWVQDQLAEDDHRAGAMKKADGIWETFKSPAVLGLAFVYFCNTGANLGLSFFMPQIIKMQGHSTIAVGLITSIPYIAGCIGMLGCGYLSDKLRAPRAVLIATVMMAAGGFALAAALPPSNWSIVALALAAVGILGGKGPFWALPPGHLSRKGAAGGIAFINAIGNLGGFAGPFALGYLKDTSADFSSGLYLISSVVVSSALVILLVVRTRVTPTTPLATLANGEHDAS